MKVSCTTIVCHTEITSQVLMTESVSIVGNSCCLQTQQCIKQAFPIARHSQAETLCIEHQKSISYLPVAACVALLQACRPAWGVQWYIRQTATLSVRRLARALAPCIILTQPPRDATISGRAAGFNKNCLTKASSRSGSTTAATACTAPNCTYEHDCHVI